MGPVIVGHEASGVVESVGPGVTRLAPGDPVVLHAAAALRQLLFLPARPAQPVRERHRDRHDGVARRQHRALARWRDAAARCRPRRAGAEYVITPANGAIKVDPDVPLDVACVIGCAVQTGVGAVLNTAQVEAGATVLIQGFRRRGLGTVQGARIAGAALIVAVDPVASRREAAPAMGATHARSTRPR